MKQDVNAMKIQVPRDGIKKTIQNNEPVWTVDMNLDPTEKKGPFILAISQPLKYRVDEAGQPALVPETPVSGEELAAIIGKIEQKAQLTVIFRAGLNAHRYAAIKSLRSLEIKPVKTTEEIFEEAQTLALEDEKKSIEAHKNYFRELQTQNPGFKFYTISQLMENQQCVALIKTVRDDYKSGKSKKLTKFINSYAEGASEANITPYHDILRAAKVGNKFYSSTDNSKLSELEIKQKFIDASKEHGLQEFALFAYLAKKHQSKCILHKGAVKKHPSKKSNLKKSFFSMHAPGLINFILKEFIDHTTEKQCKIRYKEYLIERRPIESISAQDLLSIFYIIADLPKRFYEKCPDAALLWYQAVTGFLDNNISSALIRASVENNIIAPSLIIEKKQTPIDLPMDLQSLTQWMSKFMAIFYKEPSIRKMLLVINALLYSNISPNLAEKINTAALQISKTIPTSEIYTQESTSRNNLRFAFERSSRHDLDTSIFNLTIKVENESDQNLNYSRG